MTNLSEADTGSPLHETKQGKKDGYVRGVSQINDHLEHFFISFYMFFAVRPLKIITVVWTEEEHYVIMLVKRG